jgi:hypothetical protein
MGDVLASSLGRLMVCPRLHESSRFGSKQYGGVPTYGQWDGNRFVYPFRGKTYKVHRLVCEAFHGKPKDGQVCMHLDEDSRNNRPDNLRWGSQKENLNAPGFIAYCKGRIGENSPLIKGLKKKAALETETPQP